MTPKGFFQSFIIIFFRKYALFAISGALVISTITYDYYAEFPVAHESVYSRRNRLCRDASRCFGGINKWDEHFSYDIAKEIENYWSTKIPEKKFEENSSKEKCYILSMFPYPSGRLHVGHIKVYGTADFLTRYFQMKGKNVLQPMGWDAFGLPAENAALERGFDPYEWTQKNIADMKSVMEKLNFSFDWDREFATCDSEYYKWTQFFFVKLFKMGLVYRKKEFVNWDPVDKTVLADEQVDVNGRSWRSGAVVEKKLLPQWFIKTTAFAKSLYEGLQDPCLQGWGEILNVQRNWIGNMDGTIIDFDIVSGGTVLEKDKMPVWMRNPEHIDKAKFVAVKANTYWTRGCKENGLMHYKVKNPFTGDVLPVYQTDDISLLDGSEIHLGIPELNEQDRKFAYKFQIQYQEKQNLAGEEELLELREKVCAEARERGIGGHPASSKLKDWLISRQRYWGTPIPIVHCKTCGEQPVPEEDLPVRLPKVITKVKGRSKLEEAKDWLCTTCPACGGDATRETDTMDTFVDSSWYYLRFIDPDNQEAAFDVRKVRRLAPVDIYIGGKEHAILHLFYARFMNHFLYSLDLVPHREPFVRFVSQGTIKAVTYLSEKTGEYVKSESVLEKGGIFFHAETKEVLTKQWEKMSKSKYNSVDPTEFIEIYGVDLVRLMILRASSPIAELHWKDDLVVESYMWQRKLWRIMGNFIRLRSLSTNPPEVTEEFKSLDFYMYDNRNFYLSTFNKLIENRFDVGNALRKLEGLTSCIRKCTSDVITHSLNFERALAVQIILLAPCTPYFASELWAGFVKAPNKLCDTGEILWDKSVFDQPWPEVDPDYCRIRNSNSNNADTNELIKIAGLEENKKKYKIKRKKRN